MVVSLLLALVLQTGAGPVTESPNESTDERPIADRWYDSQRGVDAPPLSADEAAAAFGLPDRFEVQVVAAEPMIRNPIAITWDDRGRLWVAENGTYAEAGVRFDLTLDDRIILLHDDDRDGTADRSVRFADGLKRLTSIEKDADGVWALCPPNLLFLPDRDRDDRIDGPAEVMLVGFDVPTDSHHTIANGLRFGPDGWLYGRCGASSPGSIRTPDSPPESAVPIAGGIWRYHPIRRTFEVLCHGTTNPWGHDWDALGEGFFVNTVNGHLWQMIPGAHFRRPHSISPNRLVYEPLEMIADHFHWDVREDWTASRGGTGTHDAAGGGHAHCGALIYRGGHWPPEFVDRLLTLNLHGRRVNVERLEPHRSGFVGRHEPDRFRSGDPWFRGLDLRADPDGNVVVIDWSDTGECHEIDGVHRSSGRLFRFVYRGVPPLGPPSGFDSERGLRSMSDEELLATIDHPNRWWSERAQRELVLRARRDGLDPTSIIKRLCARFDADTSTPAARATAFGMWGMLIDAASPSTRETWRRSEAIAFARASADPAAAIRVLALRRRFDHQPLDTVLGVPRAADNAPDEASLAALARAADDPSAAVRLAVASSLQRIPTERRLEIAKALAAHDEDSDDPNLPLMVWYGLIPIAREQPLVLAENLAAWRWPLLRRCVSRRVAEVASLDASPLAVLLDRAVSLGRTDAAMTAGRDILLGLAIGLAGQRQVAPPEAWPELRAAQLDRLERIERLTDPSARLALLQVDSVFGQGESDERLRDVALDRTRELGARETALRTLIEVAPETARETCLELLGTRYLNRTALAGLTRFDDPEIARRLARDYRSFHPQDRPAVIAALTARPAFVPSLIDAMAEGRIPTSDLSADRARFLADRSPPEIVGRLRDVWGEIRDSAVDRRERIRELTERLATVDASAPADLQRGRAEFERRCAACHRLFGSGAEIGPDLTGSDRRNLAYLIENLVDPSAVIPRDARTTLIETIDGRTIGGIVMSESEGALTLRTATALETVPIAEIVERQPSDRSLMPDGLIDDVDESGLRGLIAYLASPVQIPPSGEGEGSGERPER